MTFNPLSGIQASVTVGTNTYAFGKWTLSMKSNTIKVNNFKGAGYQQVVKGITSAELTLEAATYDRGNMPFTSGNEYTFQLGYDNVTSTTVTIMIDTIEPAVDVDGAQAIKITGQSDGAFTAAIT